MWLVGWDTKNYDQWKPRPGAEHTRLSQSPRECSTLASGVGAAQASSQGRLAFPVMRGGSESHHGKASPRQQAAGIFRLDCVRRSVLRPPGGPWRSLRG